MGFVWFFVGGLISWFWCSMLTVAKEADMERKIFTLEIENMKLKEELEND